MVERIAILLGAAIVGLLLIYASVSTPKPTAVTTQETKEIVPPEDEWFQANVLSSSIPVLVDFKAEWCGPCKMLHPHLVKLQDEYQGRLKVVEVDVDEHEQIALHYDVNAIPVVLLLIDGKVVDGFAGYMGYMEIEELVLPHLEAVGPDVSGPATSARGEETAPQQTTVQLAP